MISRQNFITAPAVHF